MSLTNRTIRIAFRECRWFDMGVFDTLKVHIHRGYNPIHPLTWRAIIDVGPAPIITYRSFRISPAFKACLERDTNTLTAVECVKKLSWKKSDRQLQYCNPQPDNAATHLVYHCLSQPLDTFEFRKLCAIFPNSCESAIVLVWL